MIGIDDKSNITIVLGDGDVGTGSGVYINEKIPFLKFSQLDVAIKIGADCTEQDKDEAAVYIAVKNLESLAVLEAHIKQVKTFLEQNTGEKNE